MMALAEADALRRSASGRHDVDLLGTSSIALETDARAIRRIAWRGVDRRRVGEPRGLLRSQIHYEQVGIATLLQAHDHALTVWRKSWGKSHAGEIADNLPLPGLDIEQIDAWIALAIGHVGDFLRRWIETWRQHEIVATCQIAHPCTVLIHDGKALHSPVFRTSFIHEHDSTVEISLLAGEALINRVRNYVCDTSPIVRRRQVLFAVKLLACENMRETTVRIHS